LKKLEALFAGGGDGVTYTTQLQGLGHSFLKISIIVVVIGRHPVEEVGEGGAAAGWRSSDRMLMA
jgi:hypothetical protein